MIDPQSAKELSEAVKNTTEIIKQPIHNSTLKPTQEIGDGFADIFYLIFSPFKVARIYTEHKINQFKEEIVRNASKIPPDKRVEPPINIAGPVLEAAKFHIEDDDIRQMFAKLLASAMNSDNIRAIHPAYVEIVKQLKPFEALVLRELVEFKNSYGVAELIRKPTASEKSSTVSILMRYFFPFKDIALSNFMEYDAAVDNLVRLQLIDVGSAGMRKFSDESRYTPLAEHAFYKQMELAVDFAGFELGITRNSWAITTFGNNFVNLCL